MPKRQYVWISQIIPNNKDKQNDFKKALAYHYNNDLLICIAKDEGWQKPYAWTDIPTGCSFGKRFQTIKEAKAFSEGDEFQKWLKKLIHTRRMSSAYHELRVQKQIYLKHWLVEDEF